MTHLGQWNPRLLAVEMPQVAKNAYCRVFPVKCGKSDILSLRDLGKMWSGVAN